MAALMRWVIGQRLFFEVLTVFLIFMGIFSYKTLKKEAFPNIEFKLVTISTVYPGATAEDVELDVTNKIEDAIQDVDGIKKVTSVSGAQFSVIRVELDADESSLDQLKLDLLDAIDRMTPLPNIVEDPQVTKADSNMFTVLEFFVSGADFDAVNRRVRDLKRQLGRMGSVATISELGVEEKEIVVRVDLLKLQALNLDISDVVQQIRLYSRTVPAGSLSLSDGVDIRIQAKASLSSMADLKEFPIKSNDAGSLTRLSDIASIQWSRKASEPHFFVNGFPAQGLRITKSPSADILKTVSQVKTMVLATPEDGFSYTFVRDQSKYVKARLDVLTNNFLIGLAFILTVLAFLLPFRVAAIIALGMAISVLGTFLMFELLGISLNLLTMVGLIIVLGILVDDAIIFIENCYVYLEKGVSKIEAISLGIGEVFGPVLISVLTTITAFMPMLFMGGVVGDFVKYIPLGVFFALIISLVESVTILPLHFYSFVKKPTKRLKRDVFWYQLSTRYERVMTRVLLKRYWVLLGYFLFVVLSVFMMTQSRFVFFPGNDVDVVMLNVETPRLDSEAQLLKRHQAIEAVLLELYSDRVDTIRAVVGQDWETRKVDYSRMRFYFDVSGETKKKSKAIAFSKEVERTMAQFKGLERFSTQFRQHGPPVGSGLELVIRGRSLDQVRASVADVTAYVSGIDGVYGLRSNAYETETLSLEFDDVLMARAGLNRVDVAMTVRDALQGRVAAEFSDNFLLYDVRVDAGDQDIMTFFKTFRCKNMQGNWIDLSAVSRLKRVKSVNVISHYNYSREMTVIADVNSELITSKALNKRVQGYVDERLANAYPDLFFSLEGEESERRASLDSLWKGFAVVVGVIFLLLVFLFQSIHYSFLILLCIPFSLVSVVWVFFLHQEVLSFFALLGMVALTGVIVNDSIIMVDYLKKERQNEVSNGVDVSQTVLMAAKARLRPIVLTSITTFVGILPTAYGFGGADRFLQPIALSLGWGIAVSTVLILFVFPALIRVVDDGVQRLSKRVRK